MIFVSGWKLKVCNSASSMNPVFDLVLSALKSNRTPMVSTKFINLQAHLEVAYGASCETACTCQRQRKRNVNKRAMSVEDMGNMVSENSGVNVNVDGGKSLNDPSTPQTHT